MSRIEISCLLVLMLGLFVPMTIVQTNLSYMRAADQAVHMQLTEIFASGNHAKGHLLASNHYLTFESKLLTMPADKVCEAPLEFRGNPEKSFFEVHANYILYLLGAFSWIIPTFVLLPAAKVLTFLGMLVISYVILRNKGVSIVGAGLFITLLTAHPAWSLGLFGQFYVERLALFFCLLYLYFALRKPLNPYWLLITALLAVLISERVAVLLGSFTVGLVVLHWKALENRRALLLAAGIASIIFGTGTLLFVINNPSYSHYMPSSFHDLFFNRLASAVFREKLYVFLVLNVLLMGIFAVFEWRLFLLVLGMMLPNMVGSIGGAEKTGWYEHYHSVYFPFLVFVSLLGYTTIYRKYRHRRQWRIAIYATTVVVVLAFTGLNPFTLERDVYAIKNRVLSNGVVHTFQVLPVYVGENWSRRYKLYAKARDAIPEGSSITMGEWGMPLFYKNRKIYFFPLGIDVADYAYLSVHHSGNRISNINSAVSFLGGHHASAINTCLFERMKRIGYDFENAVLIPALNSAVVKRISR